MIPKPPIYLFAFANDAKHSLQLEEEERQLRQIMEVAHDSRQLEYHSLGASTIDDIYKTFNRFHNRIQVFHFSGHSDYRFLELADQKARASNLAVLMGMQQHLELVLLNGCANAEQVEHLLQSGVKTVIATLVDIPDDLAITFSSNFYEALVKGKTIQEAFDTTKARLLDNNLPEEGKSRGLLSRAKTEQFPWKIFTTEQSNLRLEDSPGLSATR